MNRFKFDAWGVIHAFAVRLEAWAVALKHTAMKRSTKLNVAIITEELRRG